MPTAIDLLALSTRLAGFDETPADSCVVHDTGRPLARVMVSINATTGDLLLAKQLGCDGYLLHHPIAGSARRSFHRVLERMIELVMAEGVPGEHARAATRALRRRVRFADHAADWDQLASAAVHLDLTLLNVHLAADELGRREMVAALDGLHADATLEDAADALRTIPELAHPDNEIIHVPEGPSLRAGRVAVLHAGGTNGGASVAECLFDRTREHGRGRVETVLYIHLSGDDAAAIEQRAAEGRVGSVLVTGHFASDAIGMNLLLAAAEQELGLAFVRHGGLATFNVR